MTYSQSYYDDIQGRLRAVLVVVGDRITRSAYEFVSDELDSNELGLALEALVEELAETGARVSRLTVADLAGLASTMQMDIAVEAQLAHCVSDED